MKFVPFLWLLTFSLFANADDELMPACENVEPVEYYSAKYPIIESPMPIEGRVELEFVLGKDGRIGDIEVVAAESTNNYEGWESAFIRSSVAALKKWKFNPAGSECLYRQVFIFEMAE